MTKQQTHQMVNEAALLSLGQATRAQVKDILAAAEKSLDGPCRMYAAQTPDVKIYFAASRIETGNGSSRSKPPIEGRIPDVALSSLNLSTGVFTGATFQVEGQTLALPVAVGFPANPFIRFVFTLRTTGEINIKYSAQAASVAALTAPGDLFSTIDGDPIGWIDLEYATASTLKTAGSSSTIIENKVSSTPRIFNISGGGGSGGGAKMPMRIQTTAGSTGTISGGTGRFLDSNEEMANYAGAGTTSADFAKPQVIDLTAILDSSPANNATYYLYWDRDAFAAPITLTDVDGLRAIIPITQSSYKLLTTAPAAVNRARYVYRGTLRTATTGNTWSGAGASFSSSEIPVASVAPVSVSPVVYHASQAVGSIGSTGQAAGGHVLSAKSWTATALSANRAWFNFASASGVDGQGVSARDLAAAGAPTATTGILGSAVGATALNGTTQSFSSTNAFYKPGAAESYIVGGWFKANDWTPGVQYLLSTSFDGSNQGLSIILSTAGANTRLEFRDTTDGTSANNVTIAADVPELTSWHHVGMRYDAVADVLYAYLDGAQVGSVALVKTAVASSHILRWGARFNAAQDWFAGSVDEGFFAKGNTYSGTDIRKMASSRRDHSKDVAGLNQQWTATITDDSGCTQQAADWVVCQSDKDSLFFDLGGLTATSAIDLVMRDIGISATVVPAGKPFDTTYSANPTFPIVHGLGDVPVLLGMQEVSAGVWQPINLQGTLKIDGANISEASAGDFNASFPLSGSTRVRLIAYVGTMPAAVAEANASRGGVLTNTRQNIGGLKGLLGGAYAIENVRASEGAGTTTLTDDDNREQSFNLSAARTVVLPSTNIKKGERWIFENRATFELTIQPSGGGTTATLGLGKVGLIALQDAPTSTAHWQVADGGSEVRSTAVTTFNSVTADTYADAAETLVLSPGRYRVTFAGTLRILSGATFVAADVVAGAAIRDGSTFLAGQVVVDRLNGANQNTYMPFNIQHVVDVPAGSSVTLKESVICSLTDSTTGAKATVWGSNSVISGVITTSNKFFAERI